jgi:hypothetical protein
MATLCDCGVSLQNTGTPSCVPLFGVTKQYILVPLVADDGTENKIDPATTLNNAYFTALINQADDSKRWYPTGALKNVAGERADAIFETFEDGSKYFIRQGIRNVSALILKQGPELLAQLNANRCSTFGMFIIDNNGSIYGKVKNNDGFLYPIEVDANTFYAKMVFTTDTTIQKLMLQFEWGVDERDEDLRMIAASSITGINLATVSGLMNLYCTIVSTTQTVMTLKVFAKFGNIVTNYPISGLVTADFVSTVAAATSKMRNNTDGADVTVVAAESSTVPGTYTLTYSSQTVADVLQPLVKKNGLDGSTMIGTTGTVA